MLIDHRSDVGTNTKQPILKLDKLLGTEARHLSLSNPPKIPW